MAKEQKLAQEQRQKEILDLALLVPKNFAGKITKEQDRKILRKIITQIS